MSTAKDAPLFVSSARTAPRTAKDLRVDPCSITLARELVRQWHSRMPRTQVGPWKYAFAATFEGHVFAVALIHNPAARCLPCHWLELRRLAVAPDAPHCTATRTLGQIRRWLVHHTHGHEKLISYQDAEVHTGTIYRAAGWKLAHTTRARARDRSSLRPNGRLYRTDENGHEAHSSEKIRWEVSLGVRQD